MGIGNLLGCYMTFYIQGFVKIIKQSVLLILVELMTITVKVSFLFIHMYIRNKSMFQPTVLVQSFIRMNSDRQKSYIFFFCYMGTSTMYQFVVHIVLLE
jgi:hypothetical protein